jgi:hypothetical protein
LPRKQYSTTGSCVIKLLIILFFNVIHRVKTTRSTTSACMKPPATAFHRGSGGVHWLLTGSRKWRSLPSSAPAKSSVILVLIALAAAVPRLLLGASQFIEYDGYWHVFIAQQDNWDNFWADIYVNAHPPLYFLILKAVLHLGHSLLVYRSISLLTGVASVLIVGQIARKVTRSNVRAYQTALAYGLALPGIIISCEVRSYMLSVFFVLVSFWYFLEIPGSTNARSQFKSRAGFAAGAILACLSHYFAFFYAGAAIALLLSRFAVQTYQAAAANWRAEAAAEAATSLPVAGVIYTLYKVHAGPLAQIQGHLIPYYYDPAGHETVIAFLLRNWKNFINLFSPFEISSAAVAVGILILALVGGFLSTGLRRRVLVSEQPTWTILITAIMLLEFVLAALAGKYPFGGDLRQQYLLFPFLILFGAIVVESMAGKLSGMVPVQGRLLLNALAIAAIVWISAVRYEQYPKVGGNVGAGGMAVFDRLEPTPAAVYLDQFNLITFFTFHHDWDWSSLKLPQPIPGIDVYRLHRGSDQMLVFRDKTEWNLEPDDSSVYGKLARCLQTLKIQDLSVFSARQAPPKAPFSDLKLVKRTIVTLAADSAVCVQRMIVNPVGWYATFRPSDCAPVNVQPIQVTGTFDDVSDDIHYAGAWNHGSFPPAAGGTVSYSNSPGAVASVSFEGSELTYVYSKAFNRGIAGVKLDGIARGDIDLFSPKIAWQARTVFRDLPPGKHTFELTVSGRKDAAATDRYVDVDALIVH